MGLLSSIQAISLCLIIQSDLQWGSKALSIKYVLLMKPCVSRRNKIMNNEIMLPEQQIFFNIINSFY